MTLYLDASVIVPLIVTEPYSAATREWLAAQEDSFSASRLAIGEAGSAISRRRRMRLLTREEGERALAALDTWLGSSIFVIDHIPSDISEAAQMVRRPIPKLLMPDAIHLATSRRLGFRFVTGDRELTTVADMLGIDWITPTSPA